VTDEHNLKRAERWRNQVIREVAKKVTQIQNGMKFSFIFKPKINNFKNFYLLIF
jgi:hypothetical protein